MDYMTLKEASEKWGVTPRRVNYYCAACRISRRNKNGDNLADTQGRRKASGYEDITRKGTLKWQIVEF